MQSGLTVQGGLTTRPSVTIASGQANIWREGRAGGGNAAAALASG